MKKAFISNDLATFVPILKWLPNYKSEFLRWDILAGITLAFFVLPESMAYATLAGVPSYFGIYSCLVGGLLFSIFTTSKHVAIGPTSAISLMIGTTAAILSGGNLQKWAGIASLTALVIVVLCFIAYTLKLSSLVNFISDSILLGFKAGAALSIMSTQLPKLFDVEGIKGNFFERMAHLFQQLPEMNWIVLCFGLAALLLLFIGDKIFPGKPISLIVVIVSILVLTFTNLSAYGLHVTGKIPEGLPHLSRPSVRFRDVEGVIDLAFACFLVGYIETISAARTLATKNNYEIQPHQELLSMGVANLATAFFSGYAISGGLSQSTVNEKSGAKTPLSLIICSVALAIILLFFTHALKNLPEVILAVIVLHAVAGLIKIKELKRIYALSKLEFWVAMVAFCGVLVFGILKGVTIAVFVSLILLIMRSSSPNVAILGRIGNSNHFSDVARHPDNILIEGIIVFRIESSIFYFNIENIHQKINDTIEEYSIKEKPKLIILDLSASPYVDVSGSKMLLQLSEQLKKKRIKLKIVEALSGVRDILRKQGMEEITGPLSRASSVSDAVQEFEASNEK